MERHLSQGMARVRSPAIGCVTSARVSNSFSYHVHTPFPSHTVSAVPYNLDSPSTMNIIILLSSLLLFHKASALPATLELYSNLQQYHSTNINGTLTRTDPPWGPTSFQVDMTTDENPPFDRRVCFSTMIQLLASQAHLSLNDPIPEDIGYRTPEFPNFLISILNRVPNRNILRKKVFWAMMRIMYSMIKNDEFRTAGFTVKFRGQEIASILIGNFPLTGSTAGIHTLNGTTDAVPPSSQTDDTVAAGNNGVKYTYQSHGESLTQADIFMGTLGALYDAAGKTSHDFEHFISSFPGYGALTVWDTAVQPTSLPSAGWGASMRILCFSYLSLIV